MHSAAIVTHSSGQLLGSHVQPAVAWPPALPLVTWLTGHKQEGPPTSTFPFLVNSQHSSAVMKCPFKGLFSTAGGIG